VSSAVLKKFILLFGYSSGSAICLGSAFVFVELLYNQAALVNVFVYLFFTLAGTVGGFYLYFRALRVVSSKRRIYSFPSAHRPKH
jgi:drug/metabolite transporter (DMT)-like permease